jgi:hypothetical protein
MGSSRSALGSTFNESWRGAGRALTNLTLKVMLRLRIGPCDLT